MKTIEKDPIQNYTLGELLAELAERKYNKHDVEFILVKFRKDIIEDASDTELINELEGRGTVVKLEHYYDHELILELEKRGMTVYESTSLEDKLKEELVNELMEKYSYNQLCELLSKIK